MGNIYREAGKLREAWELKRKRSRELARERENKKRH
jgi:hypothetical protein